ncbi:Cilia- and flagella-associated protein 73 [Trebouxia sp. C0010 RCD-2024]
MESQQITLIQPKRAIPHTLVLEHVSPATRLLEKRRQMFEVQEALEQQKIEFNRKEEVFKRREEGLKKKDLELQESLIRFSKFLQENDAKRMHALKKAMDERKTREEKEREIEQLVSCCLVCYVTSGLSTIVAAAYM